MRLQHVIAISCLSIFLVIGLAFMVRPEERLVRPREHELADGTSRCQMHSPRF